MNRVLALALLWGCEAPPTPRIIPAGDMAVDAAQLDAEAERELPDAEVDVGLQLLAEPTEVAACGDPVVSLAISANRTVEVIPFLGDAALPSVIVGATDRVTLTIDQVPDGVHPLTFDFDGQTYSTEVTVRVDRSPPVIDWPVPAEACVTEVPNASITDISPFEPQVDGGWLGCRFTRRVRAVDACGHRTTARRTWRIGPPGSPRVEGDGATGLSWVPAEDGCTEAVEARLARAGESPQAYLARTPIEWPGEYTLELDVTGCGGPVTYPVHVQVPSGPCDAPTRPLDTLPNIRGWLQVTSQRMVDLSLRLSAAEWNDAAEPVRQAAVLLARHPGFPSACARGEICLTAADHQLLLGHLSDATAALIDRPQTRSARRCLIEAARVAVAAGRDALAQCGEQAAALVDAWDDGAARARIRCLCAGECAPDPTCADTPVLTDDPDPIAFAAQLDALVGGIDLQCDAANCPGLQALVDRTRSQLTRSDCAARTGLSITELMVGRWCAGVGRFRHPGLNALAAAKARWPLWASVGTATTLADLDAAIEACLP